jgi:hypothetical protein
MNPVSIPQDYAQNIAPTIVICQQMGRYYAAQGRVVTLMVQTGTEITVWVISLLAILLTPILLIRLRKRWVAAFNLAITNRITSRFAARLPVADFHPGGPKKAGTVGPDLTPACPEAGSSHILASMFRWDDWVSRIPESEGSAWLAL